MFAVRAPVGTVAGGVVGAAAAEMAAQPTVISGLATKAAARQALEGLNLPSAQAAAARSAISRGTAGSQYELMLQTDGRLFVHISRHGHDGFQVMQSIVSPSGSKIVTQYGVPASGAIHVHPKFGPI